MSRATSTRTCETQPFTSETATISRLEANFSNLMPTTASRYSRSCPEGEGFSLIIPNGSTQGPPTSCAVQVNQRRFPCGLFHRESPVNRVRTATAIGYVGSLCPETALASIAFDRPLSSISIPTCRRKGTHFRVPFADPPQPASLSRSCESCLPRSSSACRAEVRRRRERRRVRTIP